MRENQAYAQVGLQPLKIIRACIGTAKAGERSSRETRVMFRGAWKLTAKLSAPAT